MPALSSPHVTRARLQASATFASRMQISAQAVQDLARKNGVSASDADRLAQAEELIIASTLCAFAMLDELNQLYADMNNIRAYYPHVKDLSEHPAHIAALEEELQQLFRTKPCWVDLSALRGKLPGRSHTENLLTTALERRRYDVAQTLIEAGSPLEQYETLAKSPMSWVLETSNVEVMGALLKAGANCKALVEMPFGSARKHITPLQKALSWKEDLSPQMTEQLLRAGANPNGISADRPIPPLYLCRNANTAKMLISYGANPNYYTPKAAEIFRFSYNSEFSSQFVQAVLDAGGNITGQTLLKKIYDDSFTLNNPFASLQIKHTQQLIANRLTASRACEEEVSARLNDTITHPGNTPPAITAQQVILAANGGWLDVAMAPPFWIDRSTEEKTALLSELPPWLSEHLTITYPWMQRDTTRQSSSGSWLERLQRDNTPPTRER